MDRRDWVGIGDSSSWMGGWTPGAGWVDGHHKAPPSRDGQVGYY